MRQLSMDIQDRVALPHDSIREAMEYIQAQLKAGRKVLVHCEMGISRSASIAAGYLHGFCGMPLEEAVDAVRAANPMADPHPALLESIREYFSCAHNDGVILSGNENPLGPSPLAAAALHRAINELHRYPDKEAVLLRDKIAGRMGVTPEQVFVGNGSCELIDHITRACLTPGDDVLIPMPSFPVYRSATRMAGGNVIPVPMPNNAYEAKQFLERVTPRTKLVVVGTPNNPTGNILDKHELEQLVEELPEQTWLLIDEAYRDFVGNEELADAMSWIARGKNVIVVRSFSKAHGLAGLRIGYGAAPAWITRAIDRLRQHYNTNSLAQLAAVAAMDDTEHLARTVANNATERERMQREFDTMGVSYLPSRANFILVQAASDTVARLAGAGIQVKDMERFGAPDHFRVSIGLPEENNRFLATFASLLQEAEHNNRQPLFA